MIHSIRCIVFSLDRPMQLDAFLGSIRSHVGRLYAPVIVLYRASDNGFAAGYACTREEHPDIEWHEERDFRSDLLSVLDTSGMVVFHTDDDVFFADVGPLELHEDEVCFSLRLGLNIDYSYSLDAPERVQRPTVEADRISWNWREQRDGSFSYPLALNGHVFRATLTRSLVDGLAFTDPNELESGLHARRAGVQPRMASFATSRVVSIPANVVTQSIRNRHGGLHTPRELNERYLAGERIDPREMAFNAVASCHEEVPFSFRTSVGRRSTTCQSIQTPSRGRRAR